MMNRREAPPPEPSDTAAPTGEDVVRDTPLPSHHWTWRLVNDGYSVDECAAIRRMSVEEIARDLRAAAEEGLPMDLDM